LKIVLSAGRFDFHIGLPMPTASERAAILAQVVAARGLVCAEPTPTEVAANCDGADASGLVIILDTCPSKTVQQPISKILCHSNYCLTVA
jgi:uncharacterized metal-binding protein